MREFSVVQFMAHLAHMQREVAALSPAIVERGCELIRDEAQRVIGKGYSDWPPLAERTINDKRQHGFPAPKPLLRTGEMRASIEITIASDGLSGQVGSNEDKAVWQELGTSRIPPRSFLREAAMRVEGKIHKMAERELISVVTGRRMSPELRMIVRAVEHLGRTIKGAAKDLLDEDDQ
jgi:hypothetical protein